MSTLKCRSVCHMSSLLRMSTNGQQCRELLSSWIYLSQARQIPAASVAKATQQAAAVDSLTSEVEQMGFSKDAIRACVAQNYGDVGAPIVSDQMKSELGRRYSRHRLENCPRLRAEQMPPS